MKKMVVDRLELCIIGAIFQAICQPLLYEYVGRYLHDDLRGIYDQAYHHTVEGVNGLKIGGFVEWADRQKGASLHTSIVGAPQQSQPTFAAGFVS